MNVLLAPQEFKGSLTAREACAAMARGAKRASSQLVVRQLPLSDGGPGLVDALVAARDGELRFATVADPLGRPVRAGYGLLDGGRTAVIEMASASGLSLLQASELDPLGASTYGTGQLIGAALDAGAREFIVGIGGSATNDGGSGMAQALGARLFDATGRELPPGGAALEHLATIDLASFDQRVNESRFVVACDVRNLLFGPEGASAIYGPQKGATPAMVKRLDRALHHYADVIESALGKGVSDIPGGGAAGGLGAGLVAFLDAELRPGFPIVAEAVSLDRQLNWADIVLTGEGAFDVQTAFGKTVAGVSQLAEARGIPVIVLAGSLDTGVLAESSQRGGVAFSIVPGPVSLEVAIQHASEYLEARSVAVLRAVLAGVQVGRRPGAGEA